MPMRKTNIPSSSKALGHECNPISQIIGNIVSCVNELPGSLGRIDTVLISILTFPYRTELLPRTGQPPYLGKLASHSHK